MPKPAVADIVHYQSYGTPGGEYKPECRAAIVTEVTPLNDVDAAQAEIEHWDADKRLTVGLCVLNPTGQFFNRYIHESPILAGGTWHWPGDGRCVAAPERA